jgi:hypothetical protein
MKQPYLANVTIFKSLFDSKETAFVLSIEDVYQRIKTGVGGTKELVNSIRQETNKDSRNELKKKLKAILFAGEFSQRNSASLTKHSGFMITDFDDFENDDVLLEWREKLKQCPFVYLLFVSPSGNGLKAVIRIPNSDPKEHSLRHKAFQNYIKCDYFDRSNKDVSRVCYESYDPDIYINQYADVFDKIEQEEGYNYQEKPPIVILKNEQEIINILMKFDYGNFVEGERNNYIFKAACTFCEYGIDRETCENYLWNNVVSGNFSHDEFLTTVKSAYKKANFDSKYFEDNVVINKVKTAITKGLSDKEIIEKYGVEKEVVEDVKEQVVNDVDIFWEISYTKAKKIKIEINEWKYKEFLVKNGFAKYYPENAEKPSFVKIVENKAVLIGSDQIKDFVLNYLSTKKIYDVWNFCSRAIYIFSEKYLNFLDSIDLKMLSDDAETCYIPYKNGVVKITFDKVEIISYLDINGYIWENQILNRNFKLQNYYFTNFEKFVELVCNESRERIEALETTIGYLIHAHKNKAEQKAIIFNDQEIDDNPNGGSGKSLMLTALNKFRRTVKIDGKTFNPTQSDFVYQRVNVDTQILAFDDVKKNFNFEQLFSLITEGIPVNRKNKDEFYIPFERSPKIVITTNYVINGAGGSHDRRRHEVEFYQYFNAKRTPKEVFGKYFFDEWNEEEWSSFDNYIVECIQLYLALGLVQVQSINANKKRFIQNTSKEFFDYVAEGNIELDKEYYTTDLLSDFIKENKELRDLSSKMFIAWIKQYANYNGYQLERGKCSETKKRWLKLTAENAKLL